ncbi:hypothetical protein F3Y22_tig00110788pilonHSYRG00077 [Hibiscus syriacus]|uniref:Uncharacterized protein n=1 Tax=Hibiscus syriacus TaxID=106335 RepID=A0A6A2ZPG2_HIBSY|nr:hypothetical protein F3Y22_tig00110788pilonHSYRG00077 [Hibiscus syriacus]
MGGIGLLGLQFKDLLKKNLMNKRSTFIQLFSSLFFIFLLFGIDRATHAQNGNTTTYEDIRDPKPLVAPAIPPCEDKYFVKLPCYNFVWSGNESRAVDRITNSTAMSRRGQYEDPILKFQIPLQVAAEREIARSLIGDPNFGWTVEFKEFPHPAKENFSTLEKELKLRQAMTMMGLLDSAYWLSWLAWEGLVLHSCCHPSLASHLQPLLLSLFPPNLLAEALNLLAEATNTPKDIGVSWSRRKECAPNDDRCIIAIGGICSCIGSAPPV